MRDFPFLSFLEAASIVDEGIDQAALLQSFPIPRPERLISALLLRPGRSTSRTNSLKATSGLPDLALHLLATTQLPALMRVAVVYLFLMPWLQWEAQLPRNHGSY
jgi:hypothetical protein